MRTAIDKITERYKLLGWDEFTNVTASAHLWLLILSAAATPGVQLFRRRQQLPKRQQ